MARPRPLALALALAVLAAACGSGPSSPAPAPTSSGLAANAIAAHEAPGGATAPVDDATWALAERIAAPAYSADSTDAFKAALARAGIAVVADTSTDPGTASPELPLSGSPSPVKLLDFQAHALAVQAWGGAGWTGAELDGVAPLPSAAPSGTPDLGQLLAGYSASAVTPGGAVARALLAGHDLKDPATVRFPAVVLFLFASDLATDGGRVPAPSPSPPAAARLLPLAAGGPVVAAPVLDLSLVCAGPSGWIDAVVQNLEAALVSAMPSGIVGTVVGAALSWFIHVAAGLVKGLVDTFLAPVLTVIRGIAAIASGLAEQIASVMPFTVQVIAGHTSTTGGGTFFLGSDPERGQYTAYVSGADLPSWPEAVSTCAAAAGIELPDFTSKGVPLTFGPLDAPGDPLLGPTDQAVTTTATDDTGKAVWPFLTARDPGDPSGEQRNQFDYMPAAVHRPELDTLKRRLTLTLLGPLPGILQPFVGAILAPVLNGIQDRLNTILDVRGRGPAVIVFHDEAPPTPSPSPAVTPIGSGACGVTVPAGTYTGTFSAVLDNPATPDRPVSSHDSMSGPATLRIAADGTVSGTFSVHDVGVYDATVGKVHDHHDDSWDLTNVRLDGTICHMTGSGGEYGQVTCRSSVFGDCGGSTPAGIMPGWDLLGAPSRQGNSLAWDYSIGTGATLRWSLVVSP